MVEEREPDSTHLDDVAEQLKVLAYPNRLELIGLLRQPRTLQDIRLTPGAARPGDNPDRSISRQAVQAHLTQLIETGLVSARRVKKEGKRPVQEFLIDQARIYAFLEELRAICSLEPLEFVDPQETIVLSGNRRVQWAKGQKLVLVHGMREGTAFPLREEGLQPGRGWVIGREPTANVRLDYDPYVSKQHAEVLKEGSEFRILDLRASKNGTLVNWERLPLGGDARLRPGDVIGVGRTLMVFQKDY